MVAAGGDVVCLLNTETLANPYSETRQLLARLIEDFGTSEALGAVFAEAERPTNVAVSLVRLHKPAKADRLTFEFSSRGRRGPELDENLFANAVATRDVIGNMAAEYEGAAATAEEISQLLYHVQVMMVARGISLDDVYAHL